jgi:flagellar biogenesis protein FliO
MLTTWHRYVTRPKRALPDFTGAAQCLVRWLALPRRGADKQALELLESVPLTTQASVALVRFERQTLLLGVTAESVTLLARSAAESLSGESQITTGNPTP